MKSILGIDIGGTGIKGAIVNVSKGKLLTDRHRIPTPQPATPEAVAQTVKQLVDHFAWEGPVGCGLPAAIQQGVVRTAANIAPEWIGCDAEALFSSVTGLPFRVINDADAAGMAEMRFGVGKKASGVVMMVTLGTGIGSALFAEGTLMPNTELGHLEMKGIEVEDYASNAVRKNEALSWAEWADRLSEVFSLYHALFWPDLFIIGGGVSKKHEEFFPLIQSKVPILAAKKKNEAGIIGAAVFSYEYFKKDTEGVTQNFTDSPAAIAET